VCHIDFSENNSSEKNVDLNGGLNMSVQYYKNSIKRLLKIESERNSKKYISVVFINDDGSIDFPDNCNPTGVLAIPRPESEEKWSGEKLEKDEI